MADFERTMKEFMAKTGKSKVAIIIPLYGYWGDLKDNPLGKESLQATLRGVHSSIHQLYIFFVGESGRPPAPDVQNYIVTQSYSGNTTGVDVPVGSGYGDYVREGLKVAHSETDSAYFIVLNPWVFIQSSSIDMVVDRMNLADRAKIVSGFDIRPAVDPDQFDATAFDQFMFNLPKEERFIESNFMGLTRYAYEMLTPDDNIKTEHYLKWDIAQTMYQKGFEVIRSQKIPIFVFDADLKSLENPADVEADKTYYVNKWGFAPEG